MPRDELSLADYQRVFRKQYAVVLACTVVVGAGALFIELMKPRRFRATAAIRLTVPPPLPLENSLPEQLVEWRDPEALRGSLTGYAMLLDLAAELELIVDTVSTTSLIDNEALVSLLEDLKSTINTEFHTATKTMSITVEAENPDRAVQTANILVTLFKHRTFEQKKYHVAAAKTAVHSRLTECSSHLDSLEREIAAITRRYGRAQEEKVLPSLVASMEELDRRHDRLEGALADVRIYRAHILQELPSYHNNNTEKSHTSTAPGRPGLIPAPAGGFLSEDAVFATLHKRLLEQQLDLDEKRGYYTKKHPAIHKARNDIVSTMRRVLAELDRIESTIGLRQRTLERDRKNLERRLDRYPRFMRTKSRLLRKRELQQQMCLSLEKRLEQIRITESSLTDNVVIHRLASRPSRPVNISLARVAGIGCALGFMLGIVTGVVREMIDTSIYSLEEIERSCDVPVMSVIPHIHIFDKKWKKHRMRKRRKKHRHLRSLLVTHFQPDGAPAESFRLLRTTLDLHQDDMKRHSLLISSATMDEGKSCVAANLACAYAQQGRRVVLLECDMRRPSLETIFTLDRGPGLYDILTGSCKWRECCRTVVDLVLGRFTVHDAMTLPGLANLACICGGRSVEQPADILGSPRMEELLTELQNNYDIVILDAPPLLPFADATILAGKTNGVLLTYRIGKAPRDALRLCIERLHSIGASVLGIVLNDMDAKLAGAAFHADDVKNTIS